MKKFERILIISGLFLLTFIFIRMGRNENGTSGISRLQNYNKAETCTHNKYTWARNYNYKENIINRIPLPLNFERTEVAKNSFGDWLRHLPLKKQGTPVHHYDGSLKRNQDVHEAVVDIDAGGKSDLQQCADAVMRLRAEYLYSIHDYKNIHFNYTNGDRASWSQWMQGFRPKLSGNKTTWVKNSPQSSSYPTFMNYLTSVFTYAGTYSLNKEMLKVELKEMKIGDVFIYGNFPGHAVTIVDMAINKKTGEKLFMIAQSYMPAQDIHILKNPANLKLSPWYPLNFQGSLLTPEWTFDRNDLKRFQN